MRKFLISSEILDNLNHFLKCLQILKFSELALDGKNL
jgi:hypothetical protein